MIDKQDGKRRIVRTGNFENDVAEGYLTSVDSDGGYREGTHKNGNTDGYL
jgi:hypothetical protein